ncbi:FAD-dependent oxidoreductase [Candidatus Saccharibacteria bacterium]|nr:FAD-dependent oxidoreductase [Candidatus Saccharibacteria bacterium]
MKLKYVEKKHECDTIYSFIFEPQEPMVWEAGQYINYTLPDIPPAEAERLFTISSAPSENHIQLTTFIGESRFKQKLAVLETGEIVEPDQLGGDFVWQDEPAKKLYIAGGLGITPFRSSIVERVNNGLSNTVTLLWAGQDEQCPFLEEITQLADKDDEMNLVRSIGERLNAENIRQKVPDIEERLIYIAGSQQFVESIGESLHESGVPKDRIKYDWFDGYTGTLV